MNLRQFLPYESYTLTTKFSAEEVEKRLIENVEYKKGFKFFGASSGTKDYKGFCENGRFSIQRIIHYNNSFLPKIYGRIVNVNGQSRVVIKMEMAPFALACLCLLLAIVPFLIVLLLIEPSNSFQGVSKNIFAFCFPLSFPVIFVLAFKLESRKSKKFLAKLFEAEQ